MAAAIAFAAPGVGIAALCVATGRSGYEGAMDGRHFVLPICPWRSSRRRDQSYFARLMTQVHRHGQVDTVGSTAHPPNHANQPPANSLLPADIEKGRSRSKRKTLAAVLATASGIAISVRRRINAVRWHLSTRCFRSSVTRAVARSLRSS